MNSMIATLILFLGLSLNAENGTTGELNFETIGKEQDLFIDFAQYEKMGINLYPITTPSPTSSWEHVVDMQKARVREWEENSRQQDLRNISGAR